MAIFRPKHPFLSKIKTTSYYIDQIFSPFVFLWLRIVTSKHFFALGKKNVSEMDSMTSFLQNQCQIPLLSPTVAPYFFTFLELVCPVFILVGFATRLNAIALTAMAALFHFTCLQQESYLTWMLLLLLLFVKGPGKFSLDCLLMRHFQQR